MSVQGFSFFFVKLIDVSVLKAVQRDIVSLVLDTYCGLYVRGNAEYF